MIENILCGKAEMKARSNNPNAAAIYAKSIEAPAKLNATGKPNSKKMITVMNSAAHRNSGVTKNSIMPVLAVEGIHREGL